MNSWILSELTRPQYPPTPDILQSALAWSFVTPKSSPRARGFVFERQTSSQPKRLSIESTRPNIERAAAWSIALRNCGLTTGTSPLESEIAHAIANAIVGVEPKKGAGITAAPLGFSAALLQDPAGAMGVAGPPNFALLVNELFALGSARRDKVHDSQPLASKLWYDAITKIARTGRLLRKIDSALFQAVISELIEIDRDAAWPLASPEPASSTVPDSAPAWWRGEDFDPAQTPFGWFTDSWTKLCSDEWIDALPARRWVDWASCLLRQAFGFCFLWEASFYRTLGHYVLAPNEESIAATIARLQSPPMGLVTWATTGSISTLDVKPKLRELLKVGHACRSAFLDWEETGIPSPRDKTLEGMLTHLSKRASKELRSVIREALGGGKKAGGLRNLIETVEYSLLCRREAGKSADYYGFTRTVSRRFMHVVPSPEWIVVISAMAARGPRASCRLADVMESLQRLGLRPRIDTLVRELERAGLCASAPDGDEGILLSPAFGG